MTPNHETIESLLSGMESYVLEIRDLRAEVVQLRAELAWADQNYEWSVTRGKIYVIEIENLRAQVEAMRVVLQAIADPLNSEWWSRDKALAALDQAQP